jgi:hypothetical protein
MRAGIENSFQGFKSIADNGAIAMSVVVLRRDRRRNRCHINYPFPRPPENASPSA